MEILACRRPDLSHKIDLISVAPASKRSVIVEISKSESSV
jgi:hypothetical protein